MCRMTTLHDRMPSARFTHSTHADTTLAVAWEAMQRPETWASLAGVEEITDPEFGLEGCLSAYAFTARVAGQIYPGRASTVVSDPPDQMAVRIATSELDGTLNTRLLDASNGITVEVTLELTSKSLLASMFFPVLSTAVGNGLPGQVVAFAAQLTE